jgi:molybdopterin-containing oxidoreductase family iron-sulfur binding subunit
MREAHQKLDVAAIRARLQSCEAPEYWRSLEELARANEEEWRQQLKDEFPEHANAAGEPIHRREFLSLLGASLAIAGLSGCAEALPSKILPYVRMPEQLVPGKPLYFATAMPMAGYGYGVIAESNMGRPTKVEGNPGHPASLGAASIFAQASVLSLYDPDRSQVVTTLGRISTWESFTAVLNPALADRRAAQGAGLRFLSGAVTSPTLAAQIKRLLDAFPLAKWHSYEPASPDNARAGSQLAYGAYVDRQYRFDRANLILSLDSDFLAQGPLSLKSAREFASRRRTQSDSMNRLYVLESTPSITGAMADHRFPVRSSDIEALTFLIAQKLELASQAASIPLDAPHWLDPLVADLQRQRGASVVLAGDHQPRSVHAMVHAINHALGNTGNTIVYSEPVEARPVEHLESLKDLVRDIRAGDVQVLTIIDSNPAHTSPADLEFSSVLGSVPLRIHMGLYENETSALCDWHIPETHYLESWSDVRSGDGTASIIQPLINPLYKGKTVIELLSAFSGEPAKSSYDLVREYWRQRLGPDFEGAWANALREGIVLDTEAALRNLPLMRFDLTAPARSTSSERPIEVVFRPDPTVFDGTMANNAWLQELPKPITKLTWDNAALISPATAERLRVSNEDVIEIRNKAYSLMAPAWIVPGHADDSITLHFGYGRSRAGSVGNGHGFNAYSIQTSDQRFIVTDARVTKTERTFQLVSTQTHQNMEGRNVVRRLEVGSAAPSFEPLDRDLTLYPNREPGEYAWGMSIDLSACVGCNACVVACQAENNIPVVGKDQVSRGREMHWIRVDTYFAGNLDNPDFLFQPVPCMHCENAPCELVCPVGATTHSIEGLNEMTYNRCVGTRYCSNNCPYKVRRFNFLQFADYSTPVLKLLHNPDVTVRSRGVMEKCTYCVQRINRARITAEKDERRIRDGEIVTACQATCPADAIVFGDASDPQSRVARLKAEPRNYSLLGELNTRPRTTYLARLTNPNPEIPKGGHNG